MRYPVIALIAALCAWFVSPLTVSAQSVGDYFSINYEPVSLSENEIQGSNIFYATVSGSATCTKDLPMSVDEAVFSSRVVAENTVSGTRVTLNERYTLEIKPFPSKKGESTEIKQVISLRFPANAESGDYNITGELIEAKVKISVMGVDVSQYLPQDQFMGSVKYIALEPTASSVPLPVPLPVPTPEPTPTPVPEPKPEQLPTPVPAAIPTPAKPECSIPWWVWLTTGAAVATTVLNIVWYLRHRSA